MTDSRTGRPLDEWYKQVNRIYIDRNFYRDDFSIFAHLVEIVGGLSLLASDKEKSGVSPKTFVPKALAWWLVLCGKVGVRSVEDLLWKKFPGVCTYCRLEVHQDDLCLEMKTVDGGPHWAQLAQIGRQGAANKPSSLADWQRMYARIYPVSSTEGYAATFARFAEELGELAESLRVFPLSPGYFLSEAADVFAWLMHLQALIHSKGRTPSSQRGQDLADAFSDLYPDRCSDCGNPVCTCPPILPTTLGRIAHEVPDIGSSFSQGGTALLAIDEAMALFEATSRVVTLGDQQVAVTPEVISQIRSGVVQLINFAIAERESAGIQTQQLMDALYELREQTTAQRLTQESLETLADAIARLPERDRVINFLESIAANVWSAALIELVSKLASR